MEDLLKWVIIVIVALRLLLDKPERPVILMSSHRCQARCLGTKAEKVWEISRDILLTPLKYSVTQRTAPRAKLNLTTRKLKVFSMKRETNWSKIKPGKLTS